MSQSEDRDERGNRTRRRGFLAAGLAAGLTAAVLAGGRSDASPGSGSSPGMEVTRLGVNYPSVRWARRGVDCHLALRRAQRFKVWLNPLSTEDRVKLVRYAYDRGLLL